MRLPGMEQHDVARLSQLRRAGALELHLAALEAAGQKHRDRELPARGVSRMAVFVPVIVIADVIGGELHAALDEERHGDTQLRLVRANDVHELLLHERPPTPGLAGVAVSFLVWDVDATTAAAERAGAEVIDAPADQPRGERQSVLTDPDGHVLCLVAPTAP